MKEYIKKLCNDISGIKNGLAEISKAAKKGSMSARDNIDMLKNKKYLPDKLNRNQEIMVQSQKTDSKIRIVYHSS